MGRLKENAMMIAYQYANLKAAMFGAAVYYVSTAMWNTTIIEKQQKQYKIEYKPAAKAQHL